MLANFSLAGHFHPFEISFCGLSGSGKTTIIEQLVGRWTRKGWLVGYLKHDAHGFQMDRQGKDTARIASHGAGFVTINDPRQLAFLSHHNTPEDLRPLFRHADILIVEGYKDRQMPKVIVLDQNLEILNRLSLEAVQNAVLCIGPWDQPPQPLHSPYLSRNNIDGIEDFLKAHLVQRSQITPVYGLVLAGGYSQRMGTDKALLKYHGHQTQIERCIELLNPFCGKVFLSARGDQLSSYQPYGSGFERVTTVADRFMGFGPLGGMLSAWEVCPHAALFVLAIDLPGLSHQSLETIARSRNPLLFATCFESFGVEEPEPLCAIYEPKARRSLIHAWAEGCQSPKKFLAKSRVVRVPHPQNPHELFNINQPSDQKHYLASKEVGDKLEPTCVD